MTTTQDRPSGESVRTRTRFERLRRGYLERAPKIISALSALVGLLTLIDALLPAHYERVHQLTHVMPVPAKAAASAVAAVSGLVLLRVAAALRKRKRRAWRIAVVVTVLLVLGHVLKGHRMGEAAVALGFLALLITARSRFTAKADPTNRWLALRVMVPFLAVALSYGLGMLYLYPHEVLDKPSFGARLKETVWALAGASGDLRLRSERFYDVFHATLFGFGLITVVIVAVIILRPSEPIAMLSDEDETRLRELLDKQGHRDSLGYFALRRDKSVVWSASGKAAITYRVVEGVALASGDPIGDPDAWPGAIACYRAMVDEYGWTPAVMGCSEQGATVYKREYDLSAYELGDEAIIEAEDFTLEGRPMRSVRQACTRVTRAGYEVCVRRVGDIDAAEIRQLLYAADAWRGEKVERGYSMALSRLGDPADSQCVVAVATLDGVLRGLLHFVPWGPDGLSLDLMRRDRTADNGLNEFLITKLIEAAPELGVRRVSLNFAVLRDVIERGERIGAGPVLRVWRAVVLFLSRFWQIESLYRFNVKFRPCWEPRFLSYPAVRDIPRIAFAALEAEAFVVRPRLWKRLIGRR